MREAKIVCIHPGWQPIAGWGPVMNSWERIFKNTFEMKFTVREIQVIIDAGMAVVVTEENLEQRGYDGVIKSQVLATNVYQRAGHEWRLVLHHGSPVMQPPGAEPQLQ